MRPWSYSRLGCYTDCPKQFWYSYIEQMPGFRPESPYAERGKNIHSQAENYLLGKTMIYPPALQKVAGHAMALRAHKALPEQKYAVKEDWTPCDYKAPEAYFRAIVDVVYLTNKILHIQDWKTGQQYDYHATQLEQYVPVVAAQFPEVEEVQTRLIYVDQGIVSKPKITSTNLIKGMRILIDAKIGEAEADTIYPVRPGKHCQYCDYSRRHGGPCPH